MDAWKSRGLNRLRPEIPIVRLSSLKNGLYIAQLTSFRYLCRYAEKSERMAKLPLKLMVLSMDTNKKQFLIVLTVLLVGVATFTAVKIFRSNDTAITEMAKIEKVVEAEPAPAPVQQAVTKTPQPKTTAATSPSKEGRGVLYALLIVLVVALAVSVFLIFHLLNWRNETSQRTEVAPFLWTAKPNL